jgi:hypothetical protein
MREQLAKLAHEQWAGWMGYLFGKCVPYKPGKVQADEGALIIPKWAVDRWTRQASTGYASLSEEEQDSDRAEADRFLALFQGQLKAKDEEITRWRGRVTALSLKDGRVTMADLYEQVKAKDAAINRALARYYEADAQIESKGFVRGSVAWAMADDLEQAKKSC